MTRMKAYIASLLLAIAGGSSANVPSFAGGVIKVGLGLTSSILNTKKKPRRGWILPCMERCCPSGCCGQGGCIYNWVESALNSCCAFCPNWDEWFNCNPDCCRSGAAKGLDGALQIKNDTGDGLTYVLGAGLGFGRSILSEPVEPSSDENTELYSQLNTVFNVNLGAYGLVASLDNWGIYLGGSLATNPLCNGARFRPFKGVLSSRREGKDLYQSLFYLTFGPNFEYIVNADVSVYGGVEAGFARVNNLIIQSEAAGRVLDTKSPSIHAALKLLIGGKLAINDDVSFYLEAGRYFVNGDSGSRSLTGTAAKFINVSPAGTAYFTAGFQFAI